MNLENCIFCSNYNLITNVANVLLDLFLVPVIELLGPKIQLFFDIVLVLVFWYKSLNMILFFLLIFVRTWDILYLVVDLLVILFEHNITDLVLFYVRVLDWVICNLLWFIQDVWLLEFEMLHKDIPYLLPKSDAVKLWNFLA